MVMVSQAVVVANGVKRASATTTTLRADLRHELLSRFVRRTITRLRLDVHTSGREFFDAMV
jgi:hypothetical protein